MNMEKTIKLEIAHIMATSGNDSERFISKIYELVILWHAKGITLGMECEAGRSRH